MFQCREPTMKEVWAIAFRTLEKYYHQQNIPAIAYVLLVKLLWLSSNKKTMETRELVTPIIRTAVESQISLGTDFTLRGYLSEEWYNALMIIKSDKAEQTYATYTWAYGISYSHQYGSSAIHLFMGRTA